MQTHEVSWNIYDRLITHARNQLPDGTWTYDYTKFEPELAESWELAPDGKSVTFKLRPDATFHDGTPVTAKDVKWSFDRAVAVGGFPAIQMGASRDDLARPVRRGRRPHLPGRLPAAEQADPAQPRRADRQDRSTRSSPRRTPPRTTRGRSNGSARTTPAAAPTWSRAGSRAAEIVFKRFDDWKSGPLPYFTRVVSRQIASAGTRRALLEKGDADLSFNLPPKDFSELAETGELKVIGTPVDAELLYIDMNVTIAALRQSEGPPGDRLCHPL